jgi:hypothetical protein
VGVAVNFLRVIEKAYWFGKLAGHVRFYGVEPCSMREVKRTPSFVGKGDP